MNFSAWFCYNGFSLFQYCALFFFTHVQTQMKWNINERAKVKLGLEVREYESISYKNKLNINHQWERRTLHSMTTLPCHNIHQSYLMTPMTPYDMLWQAMTSHLLELSPKVHFPIDFTFLHGYETLRINHSTNFEEASRFTRDIYQTSLSPFTFVIIM